MSGFPSGWYPDPRDAAQERWWDGTGWTKQTRPVPALSEVPSSTWPTAAGTSEASTAAFELAERDDAMAPAAVNDSPGAGRKVLLAVGTVLLFVIIAGATFAVTQLSESTEQTQLAEQQEVIDPPQPDAMGEPEEPPAEQSEERTGDDLGAATEPDTSPEQDAGPEDEVIQPALVAVTLDDRCTLELDQAVVARSDLIRPWDHPECVWAPIVIPPGGDLWIVVLSSLNGEDFESEDVEQRAREVGVPGKVLWSSHYASLNPDLWVVFDGPFVTESDATAEARRWGGGSYPRQLSDDAGDRYCLAPDGCIGERAG